MAASITTSIMLHLMAAYAMLAAPLLARRRYSIAHQRLLTGDLVARLRLYRQIVVKQAIIISVICRQSSSRLFVGSGCLAGSPLPNWVYAHPAHGI
jgi:hypothetical protein